MIPDVVFEPEPIPLTDENGEPTVLTEELYQRIKNELRAELTEEIGKKKLSAVHECDMLIAKAKKDAKKLMDDALVNRKGIIDEANLSARQIKKEAYDEGLKKGITEKSKLLEELAALISQGMEQLKRDEDAYFEEYAIQLKHIAAQIAENVIYYKIQDDDMIMYNLVKNAIRSVRDASWIKVEVSKKLLGYADSLEKELMDSGIKAEITINDNAPDDSCVLNTSDGFIVASVSQQMENLKDYINRQEKKGDDKESS